MKLRRKVKSKITDLLPVFEFSTAEMTYYLNIESGKIAKYSNLTGGFDELGNEIKDSHVFADDKYVEISIVHPYEIFRDIERFVLQLKDSPLKEQLTGILKEKGAVRRFKEELAAHPQEEEEWQNFRKRCTVERIYAWLDENNLELETEQEF